MNTEYNEKKYREEKVVPPGAILKRTRNKMGLSKQDVADRLKLRISVIEDLEDNSCEDKQIATFTRGYIRSYSKFLGLDPEDILSRYTSIAPVDDFEQKMQSFSRKTIHDKDDSRVMGLTWIILAVALSLTSFWWWQNQISPSSRQAAPENKVTDTEVTNNTDFMDSSTSFEKYDSYIEDDDYIEGNHYVNQVSVDKEAPENVNAVTEINQEAAVEAVDAVTPVIETKDSNAVKATKNSNVVKETKEGKADTETVIVNNKPAASVAPIESNNSAKKIELSKKVIATAPKEVKPKKKKPAVIPKKSLVLAFADNCWVEVFDANGKLLLSGIKTTGDKYKLSGEPPFRVVLGVPSVVHLTYEGKKIDLRGHPAGRVARFNLPK